MGNSSLAVDDDDFDYGGSPDQEEHQVAVVREQPKGSGSGHSEKLDLKQFKFIPTKDEIRRKNYISDSVIPERHGEEDDDEH